MIQAGLRVAALFGLYLLLAGQLSTDEVVAAGLCAIAAAAVSLIVRGISARQLRFAGGNWPGQIARAIAKLPLETWRVGAQLVRPSIPQGAVQRQSGLPAGTDPPARAARGIAVLCTSLTPTAYVVAERPARQEMLVHVLASESQGPNPP